MDLFELYHVLPLLQEVIRSTNHSPSGNVLTSVAVSAAYEVNSSSFSNTSARTRGDHLLVLEFPLLISLSTF